VRARLPGVSRVSKARASAGAPGNVPPRASADVPVDRYVSGLPHYFPYAYDRQRRSVRRRLDVASRVARYPDLTTLTEAWAELRRDHVLRGRIRWLAHSRNLSFRFGCNSHPRSDFDPRKSRPMSRRLSSRFSLIEESHRSLLETYRTRSASC